MVGTLAVLPLESWPAQIALRAATEDGGKMPHKAATEWERAAAEVDRAEWRLIEALEAGDG